MNMLDIIYLQLSSILSKYSLSFFFQFFIFFIFYFKVNNKKGLQIDPDKTEN